MRCRWLNAGRPAVQGYVRSCYFVLQSFSCRYSYGNAPPLKLSFCITEFPQMNDFIFNTKIIIILFFSYHYPFAVFFHLIATEARRCYICGIETNEPFMNIGVTELSKRNNNNSQTSPKPLSCIEFEKSRSNPANFVRECPMGYNGCTTQMDG